MINRLEISNFKSVLKADLQFGRVNLFIGPNGAGKSNVLEAIGILSASLGRSINKTDLDLRGVRLSLPRLFKATFKNRDIPSTFRLKASIGNAVYQPTISAGDLSSELTFLSESISENGEKIVGRSHNGVRIHRPLVEGVDAQKIVTGESGLWPSIGQFCDVSFATIDLLADVGRYAIYTPQTALMRGLATDPRDGLIEPLGLTGGNLAKALGSLLQSANT
ncbi:MAG: AAA family ATPase, partial [Mariprofundaceae bacterium]|nr:AAA family ATPase [Mariprofundaceae bacterium]